MEVFFYRQRWWAINYSQISAFMIAVWNKKLYCTCRSILSFYLLITSSTSIPIKITSIICLHKNLVAWVQWLPLSEGEASILDIIMLEITVKGSLADWSRRWSRRARRWRSPGFIYRPPSSRSTPSSSRARYGRGDTVGVHWSTVGLQYRLIRQWSKATFRQRLF